MQQRQLRLGDVLDDYCPRERRLTNHAIVAMVAQDVKRTRCTTCETEHEYKHAKIPHQRRKADTPAALYSQVLANATGPKKTAPAVFETDVETIIMSTSSNRDGAGNSEHPDTPETPEMREAPERAEDLETAGPVEGPVHRRLIRATLPRLEGVPPPQRPIPEFTIRQPTGGRQNRFRARPGRGGGGGQPFQGGGSGRANGGGRPQGHGGRSRQGGGAGRKRSK